MTRGYSFEKSETSVSGDNFDLALFFDKAARKRVSEDRIIPDTGRAIGMDIGSDSGLEEALPHDLNIDGTTVLLYEPNLTHWASTDSPLLRLLAIFRPMPMPDLDPEL